jgi:hypothetical protein
VTELVIGKDVPWNACWTGEESFDVRPCRWAGHQLAMWQKHAPGEGKPILASPHMVRQRQSVVKLICTVCGKHTQDGDRWMFDMGNVLESNGRKVWITTEAPIHKWCAEWAMEKCPHIRKLGLAPVPFMAGHRIIAALIGSDAVNRDCKVNIPAGRSVIGHLKIAFPLQVIRAHFKAYGAAA